MGQASRSMSGEDEKHKENGDEAHEQDVPGSAPLDEDDADAGDEDEDDEEAEEEAVAAAEAIELVLLPIACVNAGKGAPLAMGIQRWLAQELAARGAKAAAPVFTALADQNGRQVPALMVFREPWTDERALEGVKRFPNAKRGLVSDMKIDDDGVSLSS